MKIIQYLNKNVDLITYIFEISFEMEHGENQ